MTKINKLAPKWNKALKLLGNGKIFEYQKYTWDNDLSIGDFNRCVVGEAWKFKDEYTWRTAESGCEDCESLAMEIYRAIEDAEYVGKPKSLHMKPIKAFEAHWCQTHDDSKSKKVKKKSG